MAQMQKQRHKDRITHAECSSCERAEFGKGSRWALCSEFTPCPPSARGPPVHKHWALWSMAHLKYSLKTGPRPSDAVLVHWVHRGALRQSPSSNCVACCARVHTIEPSWSSWPSLFLLHAMHSGDVPLSARNLFPCTLSWFSVCYPCSSSITSVVSYQRKAVSFLKPQGRSCPPLILIS